MFAIQHRIAPMTIGSPGHLTPRPRLRAPVLADKHRRTSAMERNRLRPVVAELRRRHSPRADLLACVRFGALHPASVDACSLFTPRPSGRLPLFEQELGKRLV